MICNKNFVFSCFDEGCSVKFNIDEPDSLERQRFFSTCNVDLSDLATSKPNDHFTKNNEGTALFLLRVKYFSVQRIHVQFTVRTNANKIFFLLKDHIVIDLAQRKRTLTILLELRQVHT